MNQRTQKGLKFGDAIKIERLAKVVVKHCHLNKYIYCSVMYHSSEEMRI